MIITSNKMPSVSIDIGGISYNFHSDFREWMRFESLINDKDVPESLVSALAIKLIFPNETPPVLEALQFIQCFYACGKEVKAKTDDKPSYANYNFEHDFEYVHAAFLEQYGIDLVEIPYLHWWKFSALFKGLHDCKFTEIVGCRSTDIDGNMSEKMKCHLLDMQEIYALPLSVSEKLQREKAWRFLNS